MTAITSFPLAVALVALSACALLDNPKPTDQTAVVKPGLWGGAYRGGYVEIVSVSGVEADWRLHSALSIPAGDRTAWFYVYLCNQGATLCSSAVSLGQAQISFNAQGGHTYRPRAQEQVNGSNRFSVWIEDESTSKAVSERVLSAPGS
ncbi:MAG TPA: hypothetical protein VMH26_09260 [Burkholderiales bacterium]|nr:hypothetical protein [Burkholderiales bacterium]